MNTDQSNSNNRVKEIEEQEKLPLQNSGYWAQRGPDGAISFCAPDGVPLFAINSPDIEFASAPLFILLQVYMNGFSNGHIKGVAETRHKINELIKLCL